jgi:DNA-binding NarL/FixJ family response regulator
MWVTQTAAAGKKAFSPKIRCALAKPANEDADPLTPPLSLATREVRLLNLLAQGLNNREIAAEVNLAYQTIRNVLLKLYRKIEVANRTAAVQWAQQHGLLGETDISQK